jgi:phosphatidylserine decarboxylase
MRLPLTRFGSKEIRRYGGGSLVAMAGLMAAAFLLEAPWFATLAAVPAAVLAFTLQFFRDPERTPPTGRDLVVSPADGAVVDVTQVQESDFIGRSALRIGIFMSPFDCHVNRFPVDGVVAKVIHRAGKFLKAYDPRALTENEASVTAIRAAFGGFELPVVVRQVSGVAARRIVNPLAPGDKAVRGERFGMIKFGSRCELFLPEDAGFEVKVELGARVYAGSTVLARFAPRPAGALAGAVVEVNRRP